MLDEVAVGDTFAGSNNELPLHVTLLPWWTTPESMTIVRPFFRSVAAHLEGELVIRATDTDYFGPNHDVYVRKIEHTPSVMGAHGLLLNQLVAPLYGEVHSNYIEGREGYSPHVSYRQDGRGLEAGEERRLERIQLIRQEAESGKKTILESSRIG